MFYVYSFIGLDHRMCFQLKSGYGYEKHLDNFHKLNEIGGKCNEFGLRNGLYRHS